MRAAPIACLLLLCSGRPTQRAVASAPPAEKPAEAGVSHDATVKHPFDDPRRWAEVFDDPARGEWQKPAEVVRALALKPGMVAADLGAGTGYFESHLSGAVGAAGMVLAIDTEPSMVGYLAQRAVREKLANVVPVLALPADPFLPPGRVDRVLIVDTYHHIDARPDYFRRMRQAMARGGKVAIVDFHKRELPVGPPPEHKLEPEFVAHEMQEAGWKLVEQKTFLPYQYFLIFAPVESR